MTVVSVGGRRVEPVGVVGRGERPHGSYKHAGICLGLKYYSNSWPALRTALRDALDSAIDYD